MGTDVLIVENEQEMAQLLAQHLERQGCTVTVALSGPDAIEWLARRPFGVVLTDLVMDDANGLDVLREAQRLHPSTRVILMTAFAALDNAVAALREGAYDYLAKPFQLADVANAVRRATECYRLGEENRRLRDEVDRQRGFQELLGVSPAMQTLKAQIQNVALSEATILLVGESGTGKELVARAVHANSRRHRGPFVAVNCAAIPESLLESELFGHEKGAFTGAVRTRRGLFAEAQGGTMFLDEISDMPLPLQAKLLRVLQERTVRSVGGREEFRIDVRVLSATNRDLSVLVQQKRFREDLYYRLAVIPIALPTLRERLEDIPLLARHFIDRAARALGKTFDGLSDDAVAWLERQRWPGNVRQLENVIERAVTLARDRLIRVSDLRQPFAATTADELGVRPTLSEIELDYMQRVLADTHGDKKAAARILGVSVRTIQRKTPSSRWMLKAS